MKRIKWLDNLRGIACLIVVFAHIFSTDTRFKIYVSGCGKIGVWFFMLISSFLLIRPFVLDKGKNFCISEYYIKRVVRIYPCYLAALLISIVLGQMKGADLLEHLLLRQGDGHYWYMAVLIKFYLIFPLFIYLKKYLNSLLYMIVLLGVGFGFTYLFPYSVYPENSLQLKWYLPLFIMGIFLAILFESKLLKKNHYIWDGISLITILFMLLFTPLIREIIWGIEPNNYLQNKYMLYGFFWFILVIAIKNGIIFKRFLDINKWLASLGEISYPIYLVHFPILMYINHYVTNLGWKLIFTFVTSVGVAILMHILIEMPMLHIKSNSDNL